MRWSTFAHSMRAKQEEFPKCILNVPHGRVALIHVHRPAFSLQVVEDLHEGSVG